jgi:hypothetical protein
MRHRGEEGRLGAGIAIATAVLTLVTATTAVLTPPLSGPWCTEGCFTYPYEGITSRYPRDYLWMFPAMLLSFSHVALYSAVAAAVPASRKTMAALSVVMAAMSAVVLSGDYWVQVAVIQPSLAAGETDGIALITQFNAHGAFIALEELGYVMMAMSFACMAPAFAGPGRLLLSLRLTHAAALPALMLGFALIAARYGLDRGYRFEVLAITVDWLVLLTASVLIARWFRRRDRGFASGSA